jgi:peptide/nickel transport system substrate-binding protein
MQQTRFTGRRVSVKSTAAVLAVSAVALSLGACQSSETPAATDTPASVAGPPPSGLGGTTSGPPDGTTPMDGGKLIFGIEAEPEGLDPTRYAYSGSGHMVASAVMDTLMVLDDDGKAVPNLATSMTPSADFKTWTITLPTGVRFSDGTPLTAEVVRYDMERYRASIITGPAWSGVTSVTAPDPTHVVVTWAFPIASFDTRLTTQDGYVFAPQTNDNPADDPIGTGPFIRESHDLGKSWTFKKNPNYWRKGLPHLDALEIQPIPDDAKRLAMLQAGDIDMMLTLRSTQIEALRNDDSLKLVENSGGEEDHMVLNTASEPFNSLTARQAIAYATDSARWRKEITGDVEAPANGPFAPGQIGYLEDNGYPAYNLDKAKELVAQYERESGQPLEFEFITQLDVNNQADSILLADMYKAAGINVTIKALPQINLLAAAAGGKFQMVRFRNYSAPNPDTDAIPFWRSDHLTPIALNFSRLEDSTINSAIYQAVGTTDTTVRTQAYETINRQLATKLPDIWLGRVVWVMAAQPKVNGIYAGANGTVETLGAKPWIANLWVSS